jgi:hypothetical protein
VKPISAPRIATARCALNRTVTEETLKPYIVVVSNAPPAMAGRRRRRFAENASLAGYGGSFLPFFHRTWKKQQVFIRSKLRLLLHCRTC